MYNGPKTMSDEVYILDTPLIGLSMLIFFPAKSQWGSNSSAAIHAWLIAFFL